MGTPTGTTQTGTATDHGWFGTETIKTRLGDFAFKTAIQAPMRRHVYATHSSSIVRSRRSSCRIMWLVPRYGRGSNPAVYLAKGSARSYDHGVPRVTLRIEATDHEETTLTAYICDMPDCPNVAEHVIGVVRELRAYVAVCDAHKRLLGEKKGP